MLVWPSREFYCILSYVRGHANVPEDVSLTQGYMSGMDTNAAEIHEPKQQLHHIKE
jgi:hypothetical protein